MIDLIYCAGSNDRLMRAANDAGWLLGARSDRASYGHRLAFIDIHYRAPDFTRHLQRVAAEQPRYAVVPDLSEKEVSAADVARALGQADKLAQHCDVPLIVPKRSGQLALIPQRYAIAYSVPSSYGGAQFGPWLLRGRRVHLLGGSPSTQRRIYRYLRGEADVMSVDSNMAQKVLGKLNYWSRRNVWEKAPLGSDYMDCWLISLVNIRRMWQAEFDMECETLSVKKLSGGNSSSNLSSVTLERRAMPALICDDMKTT